MCGNGLMISKIKNSRVVLSLCLCLVGTFISLSVIEEQPENVPFFATLDRRETSKWRNLIWWVKHPRGISGVPDSEDCHGLRDALRECGLKLE
jgi:hypothetical protein